jgi:molecular chaperone GrpE
MSKKNNKEGMNTEKAKDQVENTNSEGTSEKDTEEKEAAVKEEVVEEKSELELMTDKYDEMNNKYLRLYSEFDNFRKRTAKEKLELYKTAGEDVLSALLPVKDDFERAMKSMIDSEDVKGVKEGVELIYQKFESTLRRQGLKPLESAIGKEFDVNFHEAITRIPAHDKKLKGKVIDEVEKGYELNEKVIRYTKVVIGE